MRQTVHYAPLTPEGPAVLRMSESDVEGETMFKTFQRRARVAYSDFEPVEAAPAAGAGRD